jgi:DNA-directed RNA polymerase specialized sigma subunit
MKPTRHSMTAEELLALPDAELDRVPLDEVKRILNEERSKLDRLDRRLALAESAGPKSAREVADLLGISPRRVSEIQQIAFLKLRDQFPELKDLLKP